MNNDYPDMSISLDFSDPINITLVIGKCSSKFKVLFKLSESINENIPKDNCASTLKDWIVLKHKILKEECNKGCFIEVVFPNFTFNKSGIYLMSFQLVNCCKKSLGAKYADQKQISVLKFNNIYNYKYKDSVNENSIILQQDGGFWTGKFKLPTVTGFPEAKNNDNIYINYFQPSHNFNLAYGFQFDNLSDLIIFGKSVYVGENTPALDARTVLITASNIFNFTTDPNPPPNTKINCVIVANSDQGFYQQWFSLHYGVSTNNNIFPKNEVSNFAYISTNKVVKNWVFNTAITQPGKYTAYFIYCQTHRTSSIHIGWYVVMP